MCHASGSKGIQPQNIHAYRLVYEIVANELGCVKHQNMQTLVIINHLYYSQVALSFRVRRHKTTFTGVLRGCTNNLKSRIGCYRIADPRAHSGCLDGVKYPAMPRDEPHASL